MTEFRPYATVEEHDRDLVERWNATVNKADTVWHLGDVYFGGKDNHLILGRLNGIKRLVLGNHDVYPRGFYEMYFSKIYGVAEKGECVLSHIPVHSLQVGPGNRYRRNIHGHLHSNVLADSRYRCVSVEQTGYRPALLSDVLSGDVGSI